MNSLFTPIIFLVGLSVYAIIIHLVFRISDKTHWKELFYWSVLSVCGLFSIIDFGCNFIIHKIYDLYGIQYPVILIIISITAVFIIEAFLSPLGIKRQKRQTQTNENKSNIPAENCFNIFFTVLSVLFTVYMIIMPLIDFTGIVTAGEDTITGITGFVNVISLSISLRQMGFILRSIKNGSLDCNAMLKFISYKKIFENKPPRL